MILPKITLIPSGHEGSDATVPSQLDVNRATDHLIFEVSHGRTPNGVEANGHIWDLCEESSTPSELVYRLQRPGIDTLQLPSPTDRP
jgi:hypothetical protein